MADGTKISWSDATWNPVSGCTEVSLGCAHCYAKTFAERFRGVPGNYYEHGFDVQLRPNMLTRPEQWKRPRRIFVNSMSDLFHEDIPKRYIHECLRVMKRCPQHTFQILTKRIERAVDVLWEWSNDVLPNVIIGPTVENQHFADMRLPLACHLHDLDWRTMVSYEPALTAVDFEPYLNGIDWLICGGESGRKRRPFNHEWARSARRQASAAGVPFFMKQDGALRSEVYDTLPEDLRVRQFPS